MIAMWALPLSKDTMEQMYDTMLNAIITILSIYYMTGCSKALGVFRCQVGGWWAARKLVGWGWES